METVSAIIPTWNRAALIESLLTNLAEQTRPPDEVIVVDNGSRDETLAVARKLGAEVIAFPENRGFAVAVNAGIQRSSSDWVLILNNDVRLEPDWIERLQGSAQQEKAAFAVGKLLQEDDHAILDGSWDLVSRAAYAWRCGWGRRDEGIWSSRRKIRLAPMTAVLYHRRVFDALGMLETRFESYYEDVDFGVRCTLAGFEGIYEPEAVALHSGKATLGKNGARVMYLSARNQVLLLAKHYPARTLLRFAWPIFVGQMLSLATTAKHGHLLAGMRGKAEALLRWRAFRSDLQAASRIEAAISESESEIRALQKKIGFDIYWRLYFSLVPPA
ncbi:MAG TPA: glycosyltransferase family 2 protein [Bryobacteraceae bacterium]|nr:glycosyltransferase family 2 protein [Bryobacteraceae bacterium]